MCRKNNTIIYYFIYNIYYIIFIIYYSSDSPSSLITESSSVTQSLSSLSSPSSSYRMSSDPSKALLMQHFLKDLMIMLSGMAFHAADTHCATSEGAARKGRLKERCRLELRTNFFFHLRNRKKLAWIRFENIRYI
jgi:hypothetical protein